VAGFVPLFDGHVPSLGYEVLDWIHAFCCHGPGDVQGDPLDYDDEIREFIIECYRIDETTGRRKVREAILSRPKGRAKSEIAGMVVVAEALGPVRFDGWDANGQPVGRPVRSPLIKCLATEESQAGNTFENAAYVLGEWGPDMHPDVFGGTSGVRKYQSATAVYLPGGGEVRASTSGSASKDGGKETFVVPDESHLYVLPELRSMYATVMRNLGKRKLADPWALQTTTAYRPGEESIAEQKLTAWRKGTLDPSIYMNHREARGKHQRAAFIAESAGVGDPVAKRRAERLGKGDRCPVEGFRFGRCDGVDIDRTLREAPQHQRCGEQQRQQCRAAGVADAERAVGEIGHGGTEGGGCDDRRPIEQGMESPRRDLRRDERDQRDEKQQASRQVTPVKRHGDGVAAGLTQRGGGDLDDPEDQGDLRNLA